MEFHLRYENIMVGVLLDQTKLELLCHFTFQHCTLWRELETRIGVQLVQNFCFELNWIIADVLQRELDML